MAWVGGGRRSKLTTLYPCSHRSLGLSQVQDQAKEKDLALDMGQVCADLILY